MRIAVITCNAYRDAWHPFRELFFHFWPDCPYTTILQSERFPGELWCSVVARVAKEAEDDPILMLMEDFFLTAPVQTKLIQYALDLMAVHNAGCVRLYPAPGANDEIGDPFFGSIVRGTVNRISCQAAIWNPAYLLAVANGSMATTSEAGDFENLGTPFADTLPDVVLSFKREVWPWPMEYLCSAISRGLWNPDALRLCEHYGIPVDRSMREVAS